MNPIETYILAFNNLNKFKRINGMAVEGIESGGLWSVGSTALTYEYCINVSQLLFYL
jgi:hypothetical protein